MISHQVQKKQLTQADDSASLPSRRSIGASLPPGPPSSAAGQSVAEQEVMPTPWAVPATCAGSRSSAANSGVASAPLPFPSLRRANVSAPPKRPAEPDSASAPRAKRAFKTESPPPSLPLAAPSSTNSGLPSIAPAPDRQWLGVGGARNNDVALTALLARSGL
eukprot:scaffold91745_cov46-Phaeocystis_antarctica.AAC.1